MSTDDSSLSRQLVKSGCERCQRLEAQRDIAVTSGLELQARLEYATRFSVGVFSIERRGDDKVTLQCEYRGYRTRQGDWVTEPRWFGEDVHGVSMNEWVDQVVDPWMDSTGFTLNEAIKLATELT